MSSVINKNQLQELKLYGMLGNIDSVITDATKENWAENRESNSVLIQNPY